MMAIMQIKTKANIQTRILSKKYIYIQTRSTMDWKFFRSVISID